MLYHLLYPLHETISAFNVFRYITFRTALATLTALLISFGLGSWLIRKLRSLQIGQNIRPEGPQTHHTKKGTPTMGGLLIILAAVLPTLLWADLTNRYVWIAVASTLAFGVIGFLDDYLKLRKMRSLGLTVRGKMAMQIVVAGAVGVYLVLLAQNDLFTTQFSFPFFKRWTPDLGWFYVPFIMVVIIGAANAVNLTDGLDGLAIGSVLIASGTFAILTYIAGNAVASTYLGVLNVKGSGELTVFCGALVGASLGFLWFNCNPAEVFMGDVGSMALGGAIGTVAVLIKQEVLLVFVGGLFVMEAASVILQVASFKTRGRRIFRMAPLHHHFELGGWAEPKVIIRFWILAIIFALVSLSTLKLRLILPAGAGFMAGPMERVSGLRFTVVGAGRSGRALTRFLLDRGARVVLTDSVAGGLDPEVEALGRLGARLALGGHDEADFTGADRVLVSPGVPLELPPFQAARRAGVPIWGEIEFAFRFLKGHIIGITGTNGKSTTTTLLGALLSRGGLDAVACGNLGTPLIEMVGTDSDARHYAVELSSFQLEAIETFRPEVAVLLNIAPDHQDRYADHAAYRAAKARLFENQSPTDRAVLNRDDAEAFAFAGKIAARVSLFSRTEKVEAGACVEGETVVLRREGSSRRVLPVAEIPLTGVHNLENVLAAVAAADLFGVAPERMAEALREFRGLPHRIELVGTLDGVRYYNDSKATNVAATARSLESFPAGVVLILGGKDKGGDFKTLVPLLRSRAVGVVLMGKARDAIAAQIGAIGPLARVATLREAVVEARRLAPSGGVVLLAPGCASFDAYRNFEERGEDFRRIVRELLAGPGRGPQER